MRRKKDKELEKIPKVAAVSASLTNFPTVSKIKLPSIIAGLYEPWVQGTVKGPTLEDIQTIIKQEAEDKDNNNTNNKFELISHVHKFHRKPLWDSLKSMQASVCWTPLRPGNSSGSKHIHQSNMPPR